MSFDVLKKKKTQYSNCDTNDKKNNGIIYAPLNQERWKHIIRLCIKKDFHFNVCSKYCTQSFVKGKVCYELRELHYLKIQMPT